MVNSVWNIWQFFFFLVFRIWGVTFQSSGKSFSVLNLTSVQTHTPVLHSCLSFEAGELLLFSTACSCDEFMYKQELLQQIEEKPERSAMLSSTEKKQKRKLEEAQ